VKISNKKLKLVNPCLDNVIKCNFERSPLLPAIYETFGRFGHFAEVKTFLLALTVTIALRVWNSRSRLDYVMDTAVLFAKLLLGL